MRSLLKRFAIVRWLGNLRWSVFHLWWPVELAKMRYRKSLRKVREKAKAAPIKVLFVVGTSAKWKAQSLYDIMDKSENFKPYIVLVICDTEAGLPLTEKISHIKRQQMWFETKGMRCIIAFNMDTGNAIDLNVFKADIVFYHQPWNVATIHLPHHVAKSALTFYIPYYLPTYGNAKLDCHHPFHRTCFGFITLNESWNKLYEDSLFGKSRACTFLPLGHTALDEVKRLCADVSKMDSECVIYAPHWSIPCTGNENSENMSTFLWSGRVILQYAQNHPDIKWVFKPHPTLRMVLEHTKIWTNTEIQNYWDSWNSIAKTCFDGGYYELFAKARVMITDCGSFLREFASTGKPIIHLISNECKLRPVPASAVLFDSFYKVHNEDELMKVLRYVVEMKCDDKREIRLARVRADGLLSGNAAENIMNYLNQLLEIKD